MYRPSIKLSPPHEWGGLNLIPWYLIVLGAITSAIPALCMKQYAHSHEIHWLLISLISYIILLYVYYKLFEFSGVSVLYPLLKVLSILFVIGTGVLVFGEKITINIAAGILLGVGSIYLLSNSNPQ
jgi:multidrug transporter EmrE-like cation transporter